MLKDQILKAVCDSCKKENICRNGDVSIRTFYALHAGHTIRTKIGVTRKCPECGTPFDWFSRKRKIYCGPKCTWKAIARKKREAIKTHPRLYRSYLKKQSDLMHENYVKKIHEDNPGAQVARRPWKHKGKRGGSDD